MRPVEKGNTPRKYSHYKYAKKDLIEKLGCYCSYCGLNISNQADVEHVAPKSKNPSLELEWDNFLLGCKACNIIKNNNNDDRKGYPFPDDFNTAMLYDYSNGLVTIKSGLSQTDFLLAKNLFDLVKLDRRENTSGQPDDRFRARKEAFEKAMDSLVDYEEAPSIQMARVIGRGIESFHSVWLHVFKNYPQVKKEILIHVAGTAVNCYDGNYNPKNIITR